MSKQAVRLVNVVPNIKVKKEVLSEDDDESCEKCRICLKSFASEMALRNHARMEHMDAFATGNPQMWVEPKVERMTKEKEEEIIKIKTEKLISSMEPTNIMSLTSADVSYIIIKAEPPASRDRVDKKRRSDGMMKTEKVLLKKEKEKEKEVQPITGPFECLQPSTLVADGTCHQIFFSCCEYSIHFRDEHTRRRKGLRCQVCEKPLVGAGEEPVAPYTCEVCGIGFQMNKELSQHMATDHVKLKPFECSVCHKRFTQQGGVQQHMRMHTGDRPFPCTFCPKSFTQKSGLDQHLRVHTKVKPYLCIICSKTFCQSVHLKQHMRTHTNVSPFQCGICQKRFKQSSHLNYHLKNHNTSVMSEEQKSEYKKLMSIIVRSSEKEKQEDTSYRSNRVKLYQCPFCQKRFPKNAYLNYHIISHDTTVMDDEQKKLYRKLVNRMERNGEPIQDGGEDDGVHNVMCVSADGAPYVEVHMEEGDGEIETDEVQEVEMEDEVQMDDCEILDEQSQEQLLLAEHSIQEQQAEEETYILSDDQEVWSVKLIGGEGEE